MTIRKKLIVPLNRRDDIVSCSYLDNVEATLGPDNIHLFSRLSEGNIISFLGTYNIAAVPIRVSENVLVPGRVVWISSLCLWMIFLLERKIRIFCDRGE